MIIHSLLDTDLYKLTVMQFAYFNFKNDHVRYDFYCRNKSVNLGFLKEKIEEQIDHLCRLKFTTEEINYLRKVKNGIFKEDFLSYLSNFRLNSKNVKITNEEGNLKIQISGRWVETVLFEIYILSIVNELYFKSIDPNPNYENGRSFLKNEIKKIKNTSLKFSEFGTRRRFSHSWQKEVIKILKQECSNMIGTSNLLFAKDLKLEPIGTHPHECFAFYQGKYDYFNFQDKFLNDWFNFYGETLAIALTDIYRTEDFLKSFNKDLSEKYKGLRQDSGDPIKWLNKVVNHFHEMGIDPKRKTVIFSDSLNFDKALEIHKTAETVCQDFYGIGTFLTNNLGPKSLNIVMKMTSVNKKPVVKISDEPFKAIGDESTLKMIKEKIGIL